MNQQRQTLAADPHGDCGPCTQRLCATPECENWFASTSREQRYCLPCRYARQAEAQG